MARSDVKKPITSYSTTHGDYLYEKPAFHYAMALLLAAALVISIMALVNVYKIKNTITPKTASVDDFLKKLTSHAEMKGYIGVSPLNIVQISSNNLASLQSQINGLDVSYIGNFIVQYSDRVVVYDYDKDTLRGTAGLQQPQNAQLPADFFAKLNKHAELKGIEKEQPIGGQLDAAALNTLKQQFPDVYKNAKVGDFLLRYKTSLIIYDYNADKIVNSVNLQ